MAKVGSNYRRKHDRVRPRGWFSLFVRLGGWVSMLAGAGLLAATFFSALSLRVADRLDSAAGYATAVITGKSVLGDRNDPDAYRVSFTYKTGAGGRTAEASVGLEFYEGARVGAEYPVRYVLDDPSVIELEPEQTRDAGLALRVLALVLGGVGLWTLWRFGSQANAAILARRDGEKRFAVVTGVTETGVEINNRAQGRLAWREDDGQTGESLMRGYSELQSSYRTGDRIVVFRRGKDAVWEGDVGPPVRGVGSDLT